MKPIFLYLLIAFFISSCNSNENKKSTSENKPEAESPSPYEKPIDETASIKIGSHEFMTKNLDVDHYRNGDPIPQAKTIEKWEQYAKNKEGAWCYYDFKEENGKIYGKLYNGFTITDKRELAPNGWKIPDSKTWKQLIEDSGGEKVAGKKVKSLAGWKVNGDNSTGFNALPGGFAAGGFSFLGERVYYWSKSETAPDYHDHFDLSGEDDTFSQWYDHDGWGLYVRCVKE